VRGRYFLFVDADNILLADAVERLVGQLATADDDVAFIYPNLQFFGSRRDYFEAPAFNLFELLGGNYCDTCSLFDAELFRQGLRFADDIRLGHEDWDLVLKIVAGGLRGEPASFPTVLYRKAGFTRSDTVEYANDAFWRAVRRRHPELFGHSGDSGALGWYSGPAVSIKARWSPGVSVVALEPLRAEDAAELDRLLERQTSGDVELIVPTTAALPERRGGPVLRAITPADDPARALQQGLRAARAPLVLVTAGTGAPLLADRSLVEKLVRATVIRPDLDATVLCDAGTEGRYPFRLLDAGETDGLQPHALLFWRRDEDDDPLPAEPAIDPAAPVASLAAALVERAVQWRHHEGGDVPVPGRPSTRISAALPPPAAPAEKAERARRLNTSPSAPMLTWDQVRRWTHAVSWVPPEAQTLVRHRRIGGTERIVTHERTPPHGYEIEFDLGSVRRFQAPGTAELRSGGEYGFFAIPDEDLGAPRLREPRHEDCLGFLEEAPLPLLTALHTGFHRESREWVLVSAAGDPLFDQVESLRFLGFLEAFPNLPRLPAIPGHGHGLLPLLRTVDLDARRHRYEIGGPPPATLSLELGSLHWFPLPDSIPAWLHDGRLVTGERPVATGNALTRTRWVVAPIAWRDAGPLTPRVRAAARRALDASRPRGERAAGANGIGGEPIGYLWPEAGPHRRPLFAAYHPVTGDQLLTPWPLEAADLGYGAATRLGWVSSRAPLTGSLEARPVDVPWASRFGRRTRHA
jgi:hypothetical protein